VKGAIEDYHLPWGHPQLVKGARSANARLDSAQGCFMANSAAREYADAREAGAAMGLGTGRRPILRPGAEERTYFIGIFPTGVFQTRINHVLQGLFLPDGPENTRVVLNIYYAAEAAIDPAFAQTRRELFEEWQLIFEQDTPFVRYVHESYKRRDKAGIETRFSPFWESNVLAFQRSVVEVLRGERL